VRHPLCACARADVDDSDHPALVFKKTKLMKGYGLPKKKKKKQAAIGATRELTETDRLIADAAAAGHVLPGTPSVGEKKKTKRRKKKKTKGRGGHAPTRDDLDILKRLMERAKYNAPQVRASPNIACVSL
jgi:hypothetical protein